MKVAQLQTRKLLNILWASKIFNYLETAQNGNLNIAEITILTGVYRAGFHSPNITDLTVAAVPRHEELPPLAEVGEGGGGLGGGQ